MTHLEALVRAHQSRDLTDGERVTFAVLTLVHNLAVERSWSPERAAFEVRKALRLVSSPAPEPTLPPAQSAERKAA